MKRRLLLLPFLLLPGAAPALKIEIQERHGKSYIGTVDGFPLLMHSGTQRQRGEAHGRLGAATIFVLLDEALEWKDVFGN